jgi:hypothetical protein
VSTKRTTHWKQITALAGILLLSAGLLIQALTRSEIVIYLFGCTCNHSTDSEIHRQTKIVNTNNTSAVVLPDCHNNPSILHICSCKNGQLVEKTNQFVLQYNFILNAFFYSIPLYVKWKTHTHYKNWTILFFTTGLDRPPKIGSLRS